MHSDAVAIDLDAVAMDGVAFGCICRFSCIQMDLHLHLQLHSDGVALAVAVALLVSSAFSKFRRRFAAAVFLLLGRREKRPLAGIVHGSGSSMVADPMASAFILGGRRGHCR